MSIIYGLLKDADSFNTGKIFLGVQYIRTRCGIHVYINIMVKFLLRKRHSIYISLVDYST